MRLSCWLLRLALFLVAVGGCVTYSSERRNGTLKDEEICFRVVSAESRLPIPGVSLKIVDLGGTNIDGGLTDELGILCKAKKEVRSAEILLFCRSDFFCGALIVTEQIGGHPFIDFKEHLISLAPVVVN